MSDNETPPPKKAHLQKERRKAREKGQPYKTSKGKNVQGKTTPPDVATCKCKYFCKKLSPDQKQLLFMDFYKVNEQNQGTYLLNHMQLVPIGRRRHGNYDHPEESRRSCSFTYSVPDGSGKNVQVCSKTFRQIFEITPRKLQLLQTKKKQGCFVYKDTRGQNPHSHVHKVKFTENDRNLVRHHINSFPRYESHYSRKRTTNEFLSPDLNKNRMFLSFKAQNPTTKVTYKYYAQIFEQDFPKLKFKCLATDTCKKCDLFKVQIQAAVSENARHAVKVKQELHHRKAEKAQACMKEDIASSQLPSSYYNCLCMDLQQVMFVPMLTHSDMFYCRQLSCYNLGIHVSNHGSACMCMWHKGIGGRGANEISSCFFKVVTSEALLTRRLVLWCDNCGAQNKNQFLLMAVIYLVQKGFYRSIDLKYLVSGHSYMNCDRDFGLIEKRRKTCKAMIPQDLEHVVATACVKNPFTVVSMKTEDFIDFKELAKKYLNTKNLGISKISHFRVSHKNPGIVKVASVLAKESDMVTWDKVNVLKKNGHLEDLPDVDELPKIQFKCKIAKEKKKDLEGMIEYLEKEEDKAFYRAIVAVAEEDNNQEEAEDDF